MPTKKPPPRKKAATSAAAYQSYKDDQAGISRDRSKSGREIGPLPEVVNPARRTRGQKSLKAFCQTYFPNRFKMKFADLHLTAIDRMERCTDAGGLFACAMPRGSGKTTIAECAVLRAVLYGLRRFVLLVCATGPLAKRRLKQIVRELETNDALLEDFPEACYPIRALDRIHNRAHGQTLDELPTRIELTAEGVILPTIPGAASSGAVIQVAGMEGAIRGLNVSGPDGQPMRPDMAVIDDAQTRDSAKSLTQTVDREAAVSDDILGLAGPNISIAAVMLCTVIYPGDLSDRFLDLEKHPEWQGIRTRMLESFPSNLDLWDQYAEVRRESFRSGDRGKRASDFYRKHRREMDVAAAVSWPERKKPGELSGIQSAMNLYLTNPRGFKAEYQNEPEPDGGSAGAKEIVPAVVAARLSNLPRCEVPREATRLTAMIDPGGSLLWYSVVAWDAVFGGSVVDYGSWPRQVRSVFEASDPRPSLSDQYPQLKASESQVVYAGLTDLTGEILGRDYIREGTGERLRVERCMIDAGWLSQTVYQFCRQTPHAGIIYPSKGIGRTATSRGVSEWKPKPGERSGFHWRLTLSETGRGRMVQFDPDAWKTFLYERLTTAMGGRGCLTFYGDKADRHELIAAHCGAEVAEPVTIRGATFDKWQIRPHRPDNHLWDTLVGCAVAASVQGLAWSSDATGSAPVKVARKQVNIAELYKKARGQ